MSAAEMGKPAEPERAASRARDDAPEHPVTEGEATVGRFREKPVRRLHEWCAFLLERPRVEAHREKLRPRLSPVAGHPPTKE